MQVFAIYEKLSEGNTGGTKRSSRTGNLSGASPVCPCGPSDSSLAQPSLRFVVVKKSSVGLRSQVGQPNLVLSACSLENRVLEHVRSDKAGYWWGESNLRSDWSRENKMAYTWMVGWHGRAEQSGADL